MSARKRSLADMANANPPHLAAIDEGAYRAKVLRLTGDTTEDDLDQRLADEALELGLRESSPSVQFSKSVEQLTASMSSATVASDSNNISSNRSRLSESTDPTSCSSSERRPITQSSVMSQKSASPSLTSTNGDKNGGRTSIKDSFRKLSGFRKRKVDRPLSPPALANLDAKVVAHTNGPQANGRHSPAESIGKHISSRPGSVPRSLSSKTAFHLVHDGDDEDGLKAEDTSETSLGEVQALNKYQLEEQKLFDEFQKSATATIRLQHQVAKEEMLEFNIQTEHETREKHILAAEELESRQLQAEMDLITDLETEKKACLIRLRHMEAYCHPPTPSFTSEKSNQTSPATSSSDDLGRPLSRKVTDRDFHNLATQYRERDAMENLHHAKIEVLRGRQEKIHQNFIVKKEREATELEKQNEMKYAQFCRKCDRDEDTIVKAFEEKKARLQERWKLQKLVERTKMEKRNGVELNVSPLSDLVTTSPLPA